MQIVSSPLPVFTALDGTPLEAAKLYFGAVNQNPETTPVTVYWDSALTQPAAQPIRTLGGVPSRNGTPANIYTSGAYSLTVRSKTDALLYSFMDSTSTTMAAALATSTGATLIGWLRNSLNAVATTLAKWLGWQPPSVFDYMTDAQITDVQAGTRSLDHTAAINNCLSANQGKKIIFPAGKYNYNGGGTLGAGTVVEGEGRNTTFIYSTLASPTNSCLFYVSGYGAGVRSMAFYAGVTQTGGSYVVLGGPESFIDDFFMTGDFNGVLMTGNVARIRHGRFQDGAAGAIRIRAEGGDNSQLIDDVLMGAQLPQISAAGIRVRNSAALIISNTSVIQQGHNLLIDPYTSTLGANTDAGNVLSLFANNCFFDNASGNAVRIAATGTGSVVRCRFANCWLNSAGSDNVLIDNAGTGIVEGMSFESCHSVLSPASGYTIGVGVTDLSIIGGLIANNLYGVYVGQALTKLRIQGVNIGAGGGLTGNSTAITLAAAAISDVVITNNVMLGNTNGINRASTGTDIEINNNIGVDEYVSFTPTLTFGGASVGMTYTTQVGAYVLRGSMVEVDFKIILTAKGTSTGVAAIEGLPFPVSQSSGYMGGGFITNLVNMAALGGAVGLQGNNAVPKAAIIYQGAGGFGALTDANFTNTSVIYGKFFYKK